MPLLVVAVAVVAAVAVAVVVAVLVDVDVVVAELGGAATAETDPLLLMAVEEEGTTPPAVVDVAETNFVDGWKFVSECLRFFWVGLSVDCSSKTR